MNRFKNGVQKITPVELLRTEIVGYVGSIIGTLFAMGFLIYFGMWYITLAIVFNLLIQGSQLIGKWQQYNLLKKMETMTQELIE
jgi:hypothetical protein